VKQELTKREKTLLFFMGIIAIVALSIQFLIIPLSNRYTDGIENRENLRTEKTLHEIEVQNLPALRSQNIQSRERFEELVSGYPDRVPNEIIDNRWLTPICGRNQLSIVSLRFTQRNEPPPPAPPTTQPDSVNYQEPDEPDEASYLPEPGRVFDKATVFMNARGTYQNLLRLIDEVNATEYLRLTNVSYAASATNTMIEGSSTISLTFEVTMLNRS